MSKLLTISLFLFAMFEQSIAQDAGGKSGGFTRDKTFTVGAGDLILVLQADVNEKELKAVIEDALAQQLKGKGYSITNDSSAAFSASYVAEVVESLEQEELGPLGQRPARSGAEVDQSQTWSQVVRNGSMAIEIVDRATGKSVWRSSSSIDFRSTDLPDVLRAAVARSLRKFPKARK
jgi:hypothetical protein